ncbi:probable intracellular septation protein A [Xyrichtys novacula]|uniref:Probable intracellular septation protein A n=1 Tax=Xyrichtys novacula TaxID=13765 RepID=A0AAV1EPV0_XYRNO|nr:probable intracellular septation protein A [Xyrichtys novacula]
MFLYMLIYLAYHSSRQIPRSKRLKFQIVNAVVTALVLVPQLYVIRSPKSSRYCSQPLLNNLSASIALSFITAGFSVIFTLIDPVPQSLWAACHMFGLLTCGQGLCTAILTLTAASCAETTPELYYTSLFLTVASIFSTGFFLVRGGLWLSRKPSVMDQCRNNER